MDWGKQEIRSVSVARRAVGPRSVFSGSALLLRLPKLLICLLTIAIVQFVVHPQLGLGQGTQPTQEPKQIVSEEQPEKVGRSDLETFYLVRQSDGKLVPFFNLPFEEFEKLYELYLLQNQTALPQRFVLQSIEIEGRANLDSAPPIVEYQVLGKVLLNQNGWTRVPLKFSTATLIKAVEGNGRLLTFEPKEGFVLWLEGLVGQTIDFELRLAQRIDTSRGDSLLQLSVPESSIARMRLELPTKDLSVQTKPERLLTSQFDESRGITRMSLEGIAGETELTWGKVTTDTIRKVSVEGETFVNLESPDTVSFRGRLRGNAPLTTTNITVEVPPEVRLEPAEGSDSTFVEVPLTEIAEAKPGCTYVRFALPTRTSEAWEIQFRGMREVAMPPGVNEVSFSLRGFGVVGAARQTGYLVLLGSREWRANWELDASIRQAALTETDRANAAAFARFRYASLPFELKVKLTQNEPKVVCEPQLDFSVARDLLTCKATFRYRFTGPNVNKVTIDTRGWEIGLEAFDRKSNVEDMTVSRDNPNIREITFDPGNGQKDEWELVFEVTRPLLTPLEIPLPLPIADGLSPLQVRITGSEELEIEPTIAARLVAEVLPSEVAESEAANTSAFRITHPEDVPSLPCRSSKRSPKITATSSVELAAEGNELIVSHLWDFSVQYVPLSAVRFGVPEGMLDRPGLAFSQDGSPLTFRSISEQFVAGDETLKVIELPLPSPIRTKSRITISYRLPTANLTDALNPAVDLPLAMPLNSTTGSDFVGVTSPLAITSKLLAEPLPSSLTSLKTELPIGFRVAPIGVDWTVEEAVRLKNRIVTTYRPLQVSDRSQSKLAISGLDRRSLTGDEVQRLWIQTIASKQFRQERITFQIQTPNDSVQFELPPTAVVSVIAIDGVPHVDPQSLIQANMVNVPLKENLEKVQHTVEVWYKAEHDRSMERSLSLQMPAFSERVLVREMFWQILLPRDEYIIIGPETLASEFPWTIGTVVRGQETALSQSDLEQRFNVTKQANPAQFGMNQYLFYGFGEQIEAQVTLAKRWEVVSITGLAAFVIGSGLLFSRWFRHPLVAALVVAGIVGASIWFQPIGAIVTEIVVLMAMLLLFSSALRMYFEGSRPDFMPKAVIGGEAGNSRIEIPSATDNRGSEVSNVEGVVTQVTQGARS